MSHQILMFLIGPGTMESIIMYFVEPFAATSFLTLANAFFNLLF
jgi:hypothetical protein